MDLGPALAGDLVALGEGVLALEGVETRQPERLSDVSGGELVGLRATARVATDRA